MAVDTVRFDKLSDDQTSAVIVLFRQKIRAAILQESLPSSESIRLRAAEIFESMAATPLFSGDTITSTLKISLEIPVTRIIKAIKEASETKVKRGL